MNEMALLETTFDSVHPSTGSSSSVAGPFEHHCSGAVVASNRLSAPECGTDAAGVSLRKSQTTSSLVDVNESEFYCHSVLLIVTKSSAVVSITDHTAYNVWYSY